MPYKDKDQQRAYMNAWMQKRRMAWIAENGPCRRCGTWDNLQVDHVDRDTKVDHKVWSWRKERREAELVKCQVLCRRCHKIKGEEEGSRIPPTHGTLGRYLFGGCRCSLCCARKRAYWRYCHLRRKMREEGVIITKSVEGTLRIQAGYPKIPSVASVSSPP